MLPSYVNWVVAADGQTEVYHVETGTVTETGEQIVASVKAIASEIQCIHMPHNPSIIHFVSDSGGAYKKARRLLKAEGVSKKMHTCLW